MISHIRKGTIWYSLPYVQHFIDASSFDEFDCDAFQQGDHLDGENAVLDVKTEGVYIDRSIKTDLPRAVSSGFTVNGTWANHFNLYERTYMPNYTRIRLRMWPGKWVPYDTPDARYDPPRYPGEDECDYDVTYEVYGDVYVVKYGWLGVPHCKCRRGVTAEYEKGKFSMEYIEEDLGPISFPTIGARHVVIDDSRHLDIRELVSRVVDTQVSKSIANAQGLHDTLIREAVDSLPALHTNNLDNMKNVIEIFTAIATRNFPSIPKTIPKLLAKGWLSYRYSYTTTKLDLEEVRKQLPLLLSDLSKVGRSRKQVGNLSSAAKLHVRDAYQSRFVDRLYTFLDRWGLAPTWENLWDLVPFTFMVDWFTDWADFAHEVHTQKTLEQQYDVTCLVYSWKIRGELDWPGLSGTFTYYKRSVTDTVVLDHDISWYRSDTTANKTWCFRLMDGISMLIS